MKQITRNSPGFMAPSWSTDGKILYVDALEDGKRRIYSVSASGGEPRFYGKASTQSKLLATNSCFTSSWIEGGLMAARSSVTQRKILSDCWWPIINPLGAGFILWMTVSTTLAVPPQDSLVRFVSTRSALANQ